MMAMFGELDAYMIDFEPYRGGTNPNHTYENGSKMLNFLKMGTLRDQQKKTEFCNSIFQWLKRKLKDLGQVVVTIAPGHKANPNPTGFMHEIVGRLLADKDCSIIDGRCQLIRTSSVPKQSQAPGMRSEDTHKGTIEIKGSPDNEGKVVVILDDIWTSGSTLRVCREVMLTTKPKEVKLFAIGKTVSM